MSIRYIKTSHKEPSEEAQTQAAILQYLNARGHYAKRVNVQGVPIHGKYDKNGKQRLRPAPNKGMADIIGITRTGGRFIAIEVKSSTGKLSEDGLQEEYLRNIHERGGIAMVARSLDEVIAIGL